MLGRRLHPGSARGLPHTPLRAQGPDLPSLREPCSKPPWPGHLHPTLRPCLRSALSISSPPFGLDAQVPGRHSIKAWGEDGMGCRVRGSGGALGGRWWDQHRCPTHKLSSSQSQAWVTPGGRGPHPVGSDIFSAPAYPSQPRPQAEGTQQTRRGRGRTGRAHLRPLLVVVGLPGDPHVHRTPLPRLLRQGARSAAGRGLLTPHHHPDSWRHRAPPGPPERRPEPSPAGGPPFRPADARSP